MGVVAKTVAAQNDTSAACTSAANRLRKDLAAVAARERAWAGTLGEARHDVAVTRALIARAAEGRDVLPDALRERGAEVQVVMTAAARQFIGALTFQALSGRPVRTDLWDSAAEAAMGHIELARWAEAVLVGPATAGFIGRLVQGRGDDLLATQCLGRAAPIAVAPAMNRVMWANAATAANIERLRERGVHVFGPAEGAQACGEVGEGRMLEPAELADRLDALLPATGSLVGRRVLITAGPTRERIDPVRFLSNRSSGKMGFAVPPAVCAPGGGAGVVGGRGESEGAELARPLGREGSCYPMVGNFCLETGVQ